MPPDAEQIVLYPTAGWPHHDGTHWVMPVHARVTTAVVDSRRRRLLIRLLRRSTGIEANGPQAQLLTERMTPFLLQELQGRSLRVQIGDITADFGPTDDGGHASTLLRIPRKMTAGGHVIRAWNPSNPAVFGQTPVQLIESRGWSLISDIDVTIKHSDVRHPRALLRNTFSEPFQSIPGMAKRYQRWAEQGLSFHYVSSSPWQLLEPLLDFIQKDGFPNGSMHLKQLRVLDRSALRLLQEPKQSKPPILRSILDAWPKRRFILVGDSGEQDPEIYCDLANERPQQIAKIFIRLTQPASTEAARWQQLSKTAPPGMFQVFQSADEIHLPPDIKSLSAPIP